MTWRTLNDSEARDTFKDDQESKSKDKQIELHKTKNLLDLRGEDDQNIKIATDWIKLFAHLFI